MNLETIKVVIADRGCVSARTLCLQARAGDPLPETREEIERSNAEWQRTYAACNRLLRKLHKEGVLKVSRKSHFVPMVGQQPTEYKFA